MKIVDWRALKTRSDEIMNIILRYCLLVSTAFDINRVHLQLSPSSKYLVIIIIGLMVAVSKCVQSSAYKLTELVILNN